MVKTTQQRSSAKTPRVEIGFEEGEGCWKRSRQQG